jgi:hypothetical protein
MDPRDKREDDSLVVALPVRSRCVNPALKASAKI